MGLINVVSVPSAPPSIRGLFKITTFGGHRYSGRAKLGSDVVTSMINVPGSKAPPITSIPGSKLAASNASSPEVHNKAGLFVVPYKPEVS